jgi:hypothetical protein
MLKAPSICSRPPQNLRELIADWMLYSFGGWIQVPKTSGGSLKRSFWSFSCISLILRISLSRDERLISGSE